MYVKDSVTGVDSVVNGECVNIYLIMKKEKRYVVYMKIDHQNAECSQRLLQY